MRIWNSILFIIALTNAPAAFAQQTSISREEYVNQLMNFVPRLIVDHCSGAVPELHDHLNTAYLDFDLRIKVASTAVLKRIGAKEDLTKGVPIREQNELLRIKEKMREAISKNEPHSYCKQFLEKLKTIDAKEMAASAERQYSEMRILKNSVK